MVHMRPRKLLITLLTSLCLALFALPSLAQEATHVVQPGENLFRIALRYGVDVDTMAQYNGISNAWTIYAGQTLRIPGADAAPAPAPVEAVPVAEVLPVASGPAQYHTVQRGENLAGIARQYGLTPEALAQQNSLLNPNLIYAGQELLVTGSAAALPEALPAAAPVEVAAAPAASTTYTVQPGDHLASIADRLGVSWMSIAQANNLSNADHIEVGQTLMIPSASAASAVDFGIVLPAAPAAAVATGRSIVVDLSDSRIYAYEDGRLVRNVLASTGLPATPTVQGDYAIYVKYPAQTMSGPGYYLPDVPYVMYFYQGYGIHGTYWHNNFGRPMSHGCVNLPTPEAEWFYNWASVGTPVHVQY
jgi:LysM repeat protein